MGNTALKTEQDTVWFVSPNGQRLASPYSLYSGSKRIEAASPLAVSLKTVVVAELWENIPLIEGSNDILISTKSYLGNRTPVRRLHYYKRDVAKGTVINNMLSDTILVTDDYNGEDRIWFEIDVVEVDKDDGEFQKTINAIQSLAGTAGLVFPVLLPYTAAAGIGAGLMGKLKEAVSRNKNVIQAQFALHSGVCGKGDAPLQCGTYVFFAEPPQKNVSEYKCQNNGLITPADISYAVVDVSNNKQVSPEMVLNQKMATLLQQIEGEDEHPASDAIGFLQDTVTQYSSFKKIQRYIGLKNKSVLSDAEKSLMEKLEKDAAIEPIIGQFGQGG